MDGIGTYSLFSYLLLSGAWDVLTSRALDSRLRPFLRRGWMLLKWHVFLLAWRLICQVFGRVTAGWDVVKGIETVATDKDMPTPSCSTPILFFPFPFLSCFPLTDTNRAVGRRSTRRPRRHGAKRRDKGTEY